MPTDEAAISQFLEFAHRDFVPETALRAKPYISQSNDGLGEIPQRT